MAPNAARSTVTMGAVIKVRKRATMLTDTIVKHICTYLQQYFGNRGVNHFDAEDLIQDVFVRVLKMDKAELLCSQRYIYRVARSVLVDRYRADKKYQNEVALEGMLDNGAELLEQIADQDSPDKLFDMHSLGIRISNCYNKMPAQRKKVVDLYLYQNQSCKEVAAQCDISCSAVEKQVRKGRTEFMSEVYATASGAVS